MQADKTKRRGIRLLTGEKRDRLRLRRQGSQTPGCPVATGNGVESGMRGSLGTVVSPGPWEKGKLWLSSEVSLFVWRAEGPSVGDLGGMAL